jgi:NarL family two-component system response regulator LiaR
VTPVLRLAILNDYQLVVAGLASLLAPFEDRVMLVELNSRVPVSADVDIVLYDSFGQPQGADMRLDEMTRGSETKVVVFSWNDQRQLVEAAMARGADGYLTKGLPPEALVAALHRIAAGELVTPTAETMPAGDGIGRWPGDEQGLTAREAEVLALVCQGFSNEEIADRAFLSLSTIKTHLRTIFRKTGVQNRTQAALWGVDHGFRPDTTHHRLQGRGA